MRDGPNCDAKPRASLCQRFDGSVIGMDLGTICLCAGIHKCGRAEIIPNEQGNRITPSNMSKATLVNCKLTFLTSMEVVLSCFCHSLEISSLLKCCGQHAECYIAFWTSSIWPFQMALFAHVFAVGRVIQISFNSCFDCNIVVSSAH